MEGIGLGEGRRKGGDRDRGRKEAGRGHGWGRKEGARSQGGVAGT